MKNRARLPRPPRLRAGTYEILVNGVERTVVVFFVGRKSVVRYEVDGLDLEAIPAREFPLVLAACNAAGRVTEHRGAL